jgi:hypothetical protein
LADSAVDFFSAFATGFFTDWAGACASTIELNVTATAAAARTLITRRIEIPPVLSIPLAGTAAGWRPLHSQGAYQVRLRGSK